MKNRFPLILFTLYLIEFIVLAVHPYDRAVWWSENIPIMAIVAALALTFRRFRFSNTAYLLMAVLIFLHTIGGHYSFERVPFGFVTNLFGFARNHFDRMAHFSVGFYAFAAAELLLVRKWTSSRWVLFLFPIFMIFAVASLYEIFEWQYAIHAAPDQGIAFLGSQGDPWDAQADMLSDGLGSFAATALFFLIYRHKIREL